MSKTITGFVIAILAVGGGAFYGGMKYGQIKAGSNFFGAERAQRFQQFVGGQARGVRGGVGASFINGQIIAKDDKSLTVGLRDGGSKIIFLSSGTQIMKAVDGSAADLAAGMSVMVTGTANADGSLTAQSIQLRPAASTPER